MQIIEFRVNVPLISQIINDYRIKLILTPELYSRHKLADSMRINKSFQLVLEPVEVGNHGANEQRQNKGKERTPLVWLYF